MIEDGVRDPVVLLFARRPVAGEVKSRLAAKIGHESSSFIYSQLLCRTIAELNKVRGAQRWLVSASKNDVPWFEIMCPTGWKISSQVEGNIGLRMRSAFKNHLAANASVILVGSDIADLSFKDIEKGFNLLGEEGSSVIGPSTDGGYWAIGLTTFVPSIFEGINWSSPEVFEQTIEKIEKSGTSLALLPIRTDIDEVEDLFSVLLSS